MSPTRALLGVIMILGPLGATVKEEKAGSEGCVFARGDGLGKERRGGGTEEKAPIQSAHSHTVPEPRLRAGHSMAPRTHPLPWWGSLSVGRR